MPPPCVDYLPPAWLPGGHLQTIYPYLFRRQPAPALQRERWDAPDGDFVEADWLAGPAGAPLVVLFHGLEGSSHSHYARALLRMLRARGWRGVVPHFRGCGGLPNRTARAYHSGDFAEIDWMLRIIADRSPDAPRFAVGVSLGGNALLKWLAWVGEAAHASIAAAAAVSAPMDLATAGHRLGRGLNCLYGWNFLRTLKRKSLAKLERFPGLYDARAVAGARTLHAFDGLVTAPLHGFRDTEDYWSRASSKPDLRAIRLPTLIVHARNDPFLPGAYLPGPGDVSPWVGLHYTEAGGHAGFASGPFPGRLDWLPGCLLHFFATHAAPQSAATTGG
ncbi:MAG: alpha/beta fold hydrolase [Burkholderiales bacterium]|nr:alpha/beta fold hydrolase [Burkholderiales bacterium]